MEAHMDKFKEDWKDYGVTVMCDSWTTAIDQYTFFKSKLGYLEEKRLKIQHLMAAQMQMVLLNSRIGPGRKRNVVEEDIGDDFLSDSSEGGGSTTYEKKNKKNQEIQETRFSASSSFLATDKVNPA
ncbi:hypothetical protein ACJX0J_013384, partial [Zea mays]